MQEEVHALFSVAMEDDDYGGRDRREEGQCVGWSHVFLVTTCAPLCPCAFTPQMLMGIVDSSVRLLNNLQDLVPLLIQLGLRHNAYKVIFV